MKYLIMFPNGNLETIEADGVQSGPSGDLWFYRYGPEPGFFGSHRSQKLVKAFKVWETVEREE